LRCSSASTGDWDRISDYGRDADALPPMELEDLRPRDYGHQWPRYSMSRLPLDDRRRIEANQRHLFNLAPDAWPY
jgi:hypothetical protein